MLVGTPPLETMYVLRRQLTVRPGGRLTKGMQSRRHLHLGPPFLLDDYRPRYMGLSSVDAAMKRSKAYAHLRNCNLRCGFCQNHDISHQRNGQDQDLTRRNSPSGTLSCRMSAESIISTHHS
ncbi:hypothetical protein SODALDRAFT_459 [Sodiomyces alkalinus F11]|uniref:Uncharacterized protein n=1 Tax=Sodiomyces alkalinus (strain CBS 110278 / VKM F-3762 / F11) TaxID=1314773 RepID=A0A3N2Q4W6_SODAK|nr:hypothetical protein SODALDRAFT_459 [Sodiomyces alkalinus F11]ROT41802.1 hypothetical protein SODALDRAFT_459 [Sodiomyces alkalinus F11]